MCENQDCGIHYRVDTEVRDDVEEFVSKVTYKGEWAIYTEDNQFLPFLLLLGKPDLPHMTLLIKVGEGSIGDKIGDGLKDSVYDAYFSATVDAAIDAHGMVEYGLDSGLLIPEGPIRPYDAVMRY